MTERRFWAITPTPAPRQVNRDKFRPPPRVLRYRAFRDEVKLRRVWAPAPGDLVVFFMPIPKSWSQRKQRELDGQPHEQKPDVDNLLKALLDAIYGDDCHIWTIVPVKLWSSTPGILIERRAPAIALPFTLATAGSSD